MFAGGNQGIVSSAVGSYHVFMVGSQEDDNSHHVVLRASRVLNGWILLLKLLLIFKILYLFYIKMLIGQTYRDFYDHISYKRLILK